MTEEQIYHRKKSDSQTAAIARLQIETQEIWGGPCRNFMYSDIPKVKAYLNKLPMKKDLVTQERGIEFTTKAEPDRGLPRGLILWSGNREGVITEDEYAKIKVEIKFCNQLDDD
ncbi:hypothetical protein [Chamaesiphon sp. VAR_48_metabat_403]|uniref:hypothetical protein n=1 Tax=Chamaesiphon sp. VAR_48_metabat_403 TaxID=2964700 RepID=UPI00286E948C|nr:hypothetical protein [Chamaesiphon sp. VAR_48_metabat_403]